MTGTSGIGVTRAKAQSGLKWTGILEIGTTWGWTGNAENGISPSFTGEDSTLELQSLSWDDTSVGIEIANIADYEEPWITVIATETIDGESYGFAVTDESRGKVYAGVNSTGDEGEELISAATTAIDGALDKEVSNYIVTAMGRTITAVYVHEKDTNPSLEVPEATPDAEVTEEPVATPIARTTADSFDVKYHFIDVSWGGFDSETVTITGNGTYAISGTAPATTDDILLLWLDAGMLGYDNDLNIKLESSAIKVGDKMYAASDTSWWYRDCESLEDAAEGTGIREDDGMKEHCRRLTYRNPYNRYFDGETGALLEEKGYVDAFNGEEILVTAGDTVTIYVTVSGMSSDNPDTDVDIPFYTETPATEEPVATETPATEEPVATEIPATKEPVDPVVPEKGFYIAATLIDPFWAVFEGENVNITGNGIYAIEVTAESEMEDIMMLWLDAGLLGYDNGADIDIKSLAIKVGETVVMDETDANWWYKDCDSLEDAAEGTDINEYDGKKVCCRRLNYRNQYNSYYDENGNCIEEKSPVDAFNGKEIYVGAGEKVTLYISVSGMAQDNAQATADPSEPQTTQGIAVTSPPDMGDRTTAESFDIGYNIYDPSWGGFGSDKVSITGNGTYAISGVSSMEMEDIMMLWLDAGLLGYDNDYNIKIESSVIQVGKTVYAASDANWWYRDCESLEDAAEGTDINEDHGMKVHSRRLNYRNQYNFYYDENGNVIEEKSPVDALNGEEIPIAEKDTVTIYITVSGMKTDNPDAEIEIPSVGMVPEASYGPEESFHPENPDYTPSVPEATWIPENTESPESPSQNPVIPVVTDVPMITEMPAPTPPAMPSETDSVEEDEDDEDDEDEEEDEDDEDLEKGDTFQKSGFIYTLLNSKSVTVSGYAKNAKSLTIATTVTYKSKKYKIVGIESDAFSDMTSLKKITIGANVKSIGKKAFFGCKKLKSIEVKSKMIVKVGNNALKNISSSAKIYVPKKKYGAYKVLFRKKGQKGSVKIVKGNW